MTKSKKSNKAQKNNLQRLLHADIGAFLDTNLRKKKVIITLIFIGIYTATMFVPYIQGYTKFPVYVVKCLGMPVAGSDFAGGHYYYRWGSSTYGPPFLTSDYFCTPEEARQNGFRPALGE